MRRESLVLAVLGDALSDVVGASLGRGEGVGSRMKVGVDPRPVRISLPAKGTTTQNDYGWEHQRRRERERRRVEAGQVCCARCGKLILPGQPWDLGHNDFDRSQYAGPEHRRCNRATAGRGKRARFRSQKW